MEKRYFVLDFSRKKWYTTNMVNEDEVKRVLEALAKAGQSL